MCKGNLNNKTKNKKLRIRETKGANIKLLNQELANLSWDSVLLEKNTTMAYDKFMVEFTRSFIKWCPLREISTKQNEIPKPPWLSRGLVNACHK